MTKLEKYFFESLNIDQRAQYLIVCEEKFGLKDMADELVRMIISHETHAWIDILGMAEAYDEQNRLKDL